MSNNDELILFETPTDVNSTAHTTADRHDERKDIKRRVVSFGDPATEVPSTVRNDPSINISSPVTPQKSMQIDVDSPYTDPTPDMVAKLLNADRKRQPFHYKLAGSTQGCDFDLLPLFICGLLRLDLFAKTLYKWNKGNSTIPHLLESLTEKRPLLIQTIIEVTQHTGVAARSLITKASEMLQSCESDTHSSIVMCMMMYVWATHPDSKKRDVTLLAIQDYVLAETEDVEDLLTASAEGKSITLQSHFLSKDMRSLPGCKRLDSSMSFTTFTQHWEDAFSLTANRLTYEVPSKTNIGSLEKALLDFPINAQNRTTHFLVTTGTTVAEKHAAIVACQRPLAQQCFAAGMTERAPTQADCTQQLVLCVEPKTYEGLKRLIADNDIDTQHMTYAQAHALALQAEKRHAHYPPLFFICDAIRNPAKPKTPEKPNDEKQPKSEKAPSDKPAKPDKIDKRDKQLTDEEFATKLKSLVAIYTSQPALAKRTQSAFGPHMYYEHPPEVSALRSSLYSKLREKNMCSCCGDADPLFPDHDWKECPYMPYNKQIIPRVDKPPVSPLSVKKLTSFPVAFNASYTGRTSPVHPGSSLHTIFSYSSCINSAEPLSAPGDVATSPHLPSTWLTHWYRCGLMIITLLLAWLVYPCVVPSSSSPEYVRPMMPHFNAHPAAITAKAHTHEIFLAFDEHDNPLCVGTDSYSEGSLIVSSLNNPNFGLLGNLARISGFFCTAKFSLRIRNISPKYRQNCFYR